MNCGVEMALEQAGGVARAVRHDAVLADAPHQHRTGGAQQPHHEEEEEEVQHEAPPAGGRAGGGRAAS
jgi:hypothetical protein